jgi:hypothetical protein
MPAEPVEELSRGGIRNERLGARSLFWRSRTRVLVVRVAGDVLQADGHRDVG